MERQKTEWRFQNIASLCLGLCLSLGPSCLTRADLDERTLHAVPSDAVELRALPLKSNALPDIQGNFQDFKLPDESRFWQLHGLQESPELKRAVLRLSEHLVGTAREKTSTYNYCQARKETAGKLQELVLTPEAIACLYWRWQSLYKERRELMQKQTPDDKRVARPFVSASSQRRKKVGQRVTHLRTKKDFQSFIDASYLFALERIEFLDEKSALVAARIAQDDPKDCRLTAARAAVMRDLENFLPSNAIWQAMNDTYTALAPCLDPTHEAFEVVNGRLALLHLDRNLFDRAASLFEVTLQGKNLKDESSYLFWRGFLESLSVKDSIPESQSQGVTLFGTPEPTSTEVPKVNSLVANVIKVRNTSWESLIDKYPLTLHALVADSLQGQDPYARYAQRQAPRVRMYSGSDWNLENVSHLMAGIFLLKGKKNELDRISRMIDDGVGVSSIEMAMFRLKVFEGAGHQRSIIKLLSQSIRNFGSKNLCLELLTLLYPIKFKNEVAQQASYIDPALVFSLIRQESSFNPRATSPVGARGLMQVMPSTARKIERRRSFDLYDPNTNIRIGAKYLHILRMQHRGNYPRLIASYNAGPNNTKKWDNRYRGEVPLLFADLVPFPETRAYVNGLMRHMYWYRELVSHLKETKGTVKMNWSWSLKDVLPRAEQFGLTGGKTLQLKIEPLPWISGQQSSPSSAESAK